MQPFWGDYAMYDLFGKITFTHLQGRLRSTKMNYIISLAKHFTPKLSAQSSADNRR